MRVLVFTIVMIAALLAQRAEAVTVDLRLPRDFGFFVGDLVEAIVDIRASSGLRLQESSLPRPGPVTTHLDLRDVAVESFDGNGANHWRLRLTYQNQFVALDVRAVEVPALTLTFLEGEMPVTVPVPGWRFFAAPLREVAPEKRDRGSDYMRADLSSTYVDEAASRHLTMLLAAGALAALALFLHDRTLWPFQERKSRVFAAAARQIAALARNAPAPEFFHAACKALHRSVDRAAGRAIHYEDIAKFLDSRPEFRPAADHLRKFFAQSRTTFFSIEGEGQQGLQAKELIALARHLAELERAAS